MHKKGFTLIELIVVIVIIGILASISWPIMTGIKSKAICTEAITVMGTLRSALKLYYAVYNKFPVPGLAGSPPSQFIIDYTNHTQYLTDLGLSESTFGSNAFFSLGCYYVAATGSMNNPGTFIRCYADPIEGGGASHPNNAPRSDETKKIWSGPGGYVVMYMINGRIKQRGIPSIGYPTDDPLNPNPN